MFLLIFGWIVGGWEAYPHNYRLLALFKDIDYVSQCPWTDYPISLKRFIFTCQASSGDQTAIWLYCKSIGAHLSAAFIPGKENNIADKKSREFNEATEWQLNLKIFKHITKTYFLPNIDLFSQVNQQLPRYVSWHPDPNAFVVHAFSIRWTSEKYYIFPPFSIIGRVMKKIRTEGTQCMLIVTDCPSQVW